MILENLPDDILRKIASWLNIQDLNNLNMTSHRFNSIFKNNINEIGAKKLHLYVSLANYSAAEKLVEANPSLMFINCKFKDMEISPLCHAFKICDTTMWMLFVSKILDNQKLLEIFCNQEERQKEYIDLEPLFDAYRLYLNKFVLFVESKETSENVDLIWLELGMKQRQLRILERKSLKKDFANILKHLKSRQKNKLTNFCCMR